MRPTRGASARLRAWPAWLLLACALGAGGCRLGGGDRPHGVVLVVLDTLRADRLSVYGHARPTSPNLERLAADGVVFERVYSNACWTLPGFVGLLSGSYPSAAVFEHVRLSRSLVERVRDAGFATAAFTEGGYVSPQFGIDRGFQSFASNEGKIRLQGPRVERKASAGAGVEATFARAFDWLRGHADARFFLMIHTYEIHMPYLRSDFAGAPPAGFAGPGFGFEDARRVNARAASAEEIDYVRAVYDGGVAAADRQIGALLALLAELGIAERTLVAVTSDHGEELADRGPERLGMHGHALYDSLLHVPLILRDPTLPQRGRRVGAQVRLVDVMPTILDRLGVPAPADGDGRSLVPLVDGSERGDRVAYAEMLHPNSTEPLVRRAAIRDGRFKLIVNAPPLAPGEAPSEIYDVAADPRELDNLASRDAPERDALFERMRSQRESIENRGLAAVDHRAIDETTREQLRALGYAH
jgi:arylsulfatase A-like enzyme